MSASAKQHIEDFRSHIAAGDIPGMAKCVEQLRSGWESLDAATQADVMKLEAIFLSMVKLSREAR